MAEKYFYAGSMGPFIYDDTDQYRSTSYVPGEYREAFITDGQIRIGEAPTHDEHVVRLQDVDGIIAAIASYVIPTTLQINTSDGLTGTVADIQVFGDGNFIQVEEKAGADSFNFEVHFAGVENISFIGLEFYYKGTSGHHVDFEIWNKTTSSWVHLYDLPDGLGYNYRFIDMPGVQADYIDTGGVVKFLIDHSSGGVASHWIQIRYIGIRQL